MLGMRVNGFELQPFLPNDTIGPLTATLNLEGVEWIYLVLNRELYSI